MSHVPSSLSPQELALLRALFETRGKHDDPSSGEGLRLLGRARDIIPSQVGRDDDSLLFLTLEGAFVIGAVRDDGGVTYARMDNLNNLRVVGYLDSLIITSLTNLLSELTGTTTSVDAVTSELSKFTMGGLPVVGVNSEPARQTTLERQFVRALGSWQGHLLTQDLGGLACGSLRKYVGDDAGAYVPPAAPAAITDTQSTVTFTGVNLSGRISVIYNETDRMFHTVVPPVTDPAGATPGNFVVRPAIPTANASLRIPYSSVPHAYETTTDALRTKNIAPEWSHYVEPTVFISQTALTDNGTYQFGPIPCLDYGRFYFQIVWSNAAGTRTMQFRLYGKMDNAVWAGAGLIPSPYNIDTFPQYTPTGLVFGSPPFAGGATPATSGIICGRLQDACMYDSLMVEMIVAGDDANNTTVTGYFGLSGAGR